MVHVFCRLEEIVDGLPPMCDMTFEIVEKAYDEARSCWRLDFRADATPYEPVGFGAIIPVSNWREQVDGEGDDAFHSFWGPVTLCSRGIESDRLLDLLADYYSVPAPPPTKRGLLARILGHKDGSIETTRKFASSIECFAVGINSNPALIADEVIHMKLFLEDGVENGRYAEVFFNVDMSEGFAALNEKDEEYRTDLIHWLSLPGDVVANPYAGQR
jgi:hypothetical protein